ncbi:MAG: OmpA family protein, partial [Saprospiraceae bacterium]
NVYFDFDKSTLKPDSEPELVKLYDLLVEFPTLKIIINGHTDNRGNNEYNMFLSESRALAVYAWLVNKGIKSSRLDFKGYGKYKPIETNKTEKGRQVNRRVEFEVVE